MTEIPSIYKLEDIEPGLKKQFKLIITESMIEQFAKLSGDYNPLHMDDSYAQSTIFKQRVCHGMLLASFFSRLAGMYIPGEKSLYLSQSLKFMSPCFLNDEITVEGIVISKSLASRIITVQTTITKNSGDFIVKGEAKILVRP
jgi:acyl dehydratase